MSENRLEEVELHLFCNMFFGGRVARRRALVGDWRTVEGVAGFFAAGSAFEAFLEMVFMFFMFVLKTDILNILVV